MKQIIDKFFECDNEIDRTPLYFPFNKDKGYWDLDIKPVSGDIQHVIFQDFLCFEHNKCIELEKYAQDPDTDRRIFYVPHYGLDKKYPNLKIVYFNDVLYKNSLQFYMRRRFWLDGSLGSGNDILCLMRHEKTHRNLVYDIVKNLPINYSYQKLGKEPKYPGMTFDKYGDVFDNVKNFLTLKPNYINAKTSIVVETTYFDQYPFITEKTLQSFLAKHTTIPVASQNTIQALNQLEFDMSYLSFNYDNLNDDVRYSKAILENLQCTATEKQKIHNQNVAINLNFKILELLEKNLSNVTDCIF